MYIYIYVCITYIRIYIHIYLYIYGKLTNGKRQLLFVFLGRQTIGKSANTVIWKSVKYVETYGEISVLGYLTTTVHS